MDHRRRREAGAPIEAAPVETAPVEGTLLHRALLRLGVPRFMADHAAALLAANRRPRPKHRGR